MDYYYRKLYALILNTDIPQLKSAIGKLLSSFDSWWEEHGYLSQEIASSSDGFYFGDSSKENESSKIKVRHPISGEEQNFVLSNAELDGVDIAKLATELDAKQLFWWLWRFYPELITQQQPQALLKPANKIIPDCPVHSYKSTVSAIVGAMFPNSFSESFSETQELQRPYLLIFTFSPVQEFIKSSRKFLDFWAGSYLLHYLSVKLCWYIANKYGPDAVITPSLWSQEIIDALIFKDIFNSNPDREKYFPGGISPVTRFENKISSSLSTAGFPNAISALIPEKDIKALGEDLGEQLKKEWREIGVRVREDIKKRVMELLEQPREELEKLFTDAFPKNVDLQPYIDELVKLKQGGCWEWNKLWEAQLQHTWEYYWTAVPLGNPETDYKIEVPQQNRDSPKNKECDTSKEFDTWKDKQEEISQNLEPIPSEAEIKTYSHMNVGSFWGSLQARLGKSIQAVKNTRSWKIPAAPGERSTISGQFSAVHPRLHYCDKFKEGGGLPASDMRLFWLAIAQAYPGLFNGSERLNAIELTKRMAWVYGGVAESLGISLQIKDDTNQDKNNQNENNQDESDRGKNNQIDYESLIRFPNLSSIAAARFACDRPDLIKEYWKTLRDSVRSLSTAEREQEQGLTKRVFRKEQISAFYAKTQRPFHVPKTDQKNTNHYNGVMFSSKWLADDMGLQNSDRIAALRGFVENAHKKIGFGDGSPSDWWVIILADGDNMGKYVSGKKLQNYDEYIVKESVDEEIPGLADLYKTRKRMGPATHVGLNRALLDFSNGLVPHLTQQRFCGKVIYSGGDDVMAVLPLEDLPQYLLSLRAAWCGGEDPLGEFYNDGGYWYPLQDIENNSKNKNRPYFTMGTGATMSIGIVIAYKSVPLATVLEKLWDAEKAEAKKIPGKNGLCFRVIYGSGNTLEALMKGDLLAKWWEFLEGTKIESTPIDDNSSQDKNRVFPSHLSPLLYRLAEELPIHACVTEDCQLLSKAAQVIVNSRNEKLNNSQLLYNWLNEWETWAWNARQQKGEDAKGAKEKDLTNLLLFTAFWVDKMVQRQGWKQLQIQEVD